MVRARVDGTSCTPLCATAFVRMQAEIRASVYGPGLYGNGRKKERKKRRERSAKQWILEGALFFHFSPSSPFLSLSLQILLSLFLPVPEDYCHLLADRPLRTCSFRFNVPVFT